MGQQKNTVSKIKVGVEVEGRLKGLKTVLINSLDELRLVSEQQEKFKVNGFFHLYISCYDNGEDILTSKEGLSLIEQLGGLKFFIISVEVTEVTDNLIDLYWCIDAVMLKLPDEVSASVARLRSTDQVKVHLKSNDVYAISLENFHKTKPSDFLNDYHIPFTEGE